MKGRDLGNPYYCDEIGIIEDDYSEESGYRRFGERYDDRSPVRLPNDHIKPEELNGEVVIINPGKRKD